MTAEVSADTVSLADAGAARERFTRLSAAIVFLVFFQAYMIAPLIPFLAVAFGASNERVAMLIPAYTLPYAFAGLAIGAASDRLGRRGLLLASLVGFPLFSLLTAAMPNLGALIAMRAVAGLFNAGLVVMVLTLVADLYAGPGRARALGWVFGAIAGGSAFGSTAAGLLAPYLGWRGLFVGTAACGVAVVPFLLALWTTLDVARPEAGRWRDLLGGYAALAKNRRAVKTYAFIMGNAMFHSGVFTWLGVLLHNRFGLGETGIGLALLGYGIPGFFGGPLVGRVVDRHGRRWIIPLGYFIAAASALLLVPDLPLAVAMLAATGLSIGFDLTHPLLAGISAGLDDRRRGQAMGINAFSIFLGLGLGSLLFGLLAPHGLTTTLAVFAAIQGAVGVISIYAFVDE